ncbi:MAG: hypothetical protein HOP91_08375, partial [Sphingomonas sp.]|nr:hypothetical protein [Sphingomonas sp.]
VGVGPGYLVSPAQMEKNQFVIGLGGTLILRGNVALSLDFDSTLNNDTGRSQSIGARVDMPF